MVGNAEDLDFAIRKYNWLEYSDNYSMKSGSLQNDYRDEINDDANRNNASANKIKNKKTTTVKSFEYKKKLIGRTPNSNNVLVPELVIFKDFLICH